MKKLQFLATLIASASMAFFNKFADVVGEELMK